MENTQAAEEKIQHLGRLMRFFLNTMIILFLLIVLAFHFPKAVGILPESAWGKSLNGAFFCLLVIFATTKIFLYANVIRLASLGLKAEAENRHALFQMAGEEFKRCLVFRIIFRTISWIRGQN